MAGSERIYDAKVIGGRLHSPTGSFVADILIEGETIAGIVEDASDFSAKETIDAHGLDVIPGVVDLHGHSRTPGMTHKEDFETISQAAAAGGITTFVDMPNVDPPTVTAAQLVEKRAIAEEHSIVDFGHFVSGSRPGNVLELAEAGATGFKIFMVGGGYPHDDRIAVTSSAELFASFEVISETGLLCAVHPFDQAIFDMLTERAIAEGRKPDHVLRAELYSGRELPWYMGVAVALELQRETGVRLHVLHTHAARSIELLRRAKEDTTKVTAAADPKYYHLTFEDMERLGPRAYSGAHITADPSRMAAIWEALRDGTIDIIDADHAPTTIEDVEKGRVDAWATPLGTPQYDELLSVSLDDVNQGLLSLQDVVRLMSARPAQLIGCYPRKGSLEPGTDADLVVIDMNASREIRDEDTYTKVGWSPYSGRTLTGVPTLTMLRGRVIARNREIVGEPGYGRYLTGVPQC